MLRFCKGSPIRKGRIGAFPAAFNPPTQAHLALAEAAQSQYKLDQVVYLLPEQFPHKPYGGASFQQRIEMLQSALGGKEDQAIASLERGLFIDVARALRETCGPDVELYLLCGRDAAERIVNWDYGEGPAFREQLEEFQLLVAFRRGTYEAPVEFKARIHPVRLNTELAEVSSSAVRAAIASGQPWQHLVPELVALFIETQGLYRD